MEGGIEDGIKADNEGWTWGRMEGGIEGAKEGRIVG
jgi:hypothetical protein